MVYPARPGWMLGIDASAVQGALDFAGLKTSANVQFVYLKATEGTGYIDPKFHRNNDAARAADVPVGAYHFFRPQRDPLRQARDFSDAARDVSTLRPALDWETLGGMAPLDAANAVLCFVNETEKLWGVRPILYSYPAMLEQSVYPDASMRLVTLSQMCDLWVAHYTPTPRPWIPRPWTTDNCLVWQFDGDGGLALPNGVDCDFDWFMGDAAALATKLGYAAPLSAGTGIAPMTVRDIQAALLRLGFALPHYGADGAFGAETVQAIKEFQSKTGLPIDGQNTDILQAALQAALHGLR